MGSAPYPKAGGANGEARGAAAQAQILLGWGLSALASGRVNNKDGVATQIVISPGLIKWGSPPLPPPARGRITVCKMGRHGQNLRTVWPLLHPRRYDVSFSFSKLLVSCKACFRLGARRDGRVQRRVLTGGSAEGRRARRA